MITPMELRPLSDAGTRSARLSRCVFVDRDGVINERIDGGYVTRWSDFHFRAEAIDALRKLAAADIPIVIVSNQRGISRGLMTPADLSDIMSSMISVLAGARIPIAGWFVCPHSDDDQCSCRKPKPGLLQAASSHFGLALNQCYMIGDSESDIEAGERAGCRLSILIDESDGSGLTDAIERVLQDVLRAI